MNARSTTVRIVVGGVFLLLASTAQAAAGGGTGTVPLYDDLGSHHYPITTAEPLAQRYFDQGLRLYYAFNHQESIRSFAEALRIDPTCAMCFWGIALAHGPNINAPMGPEAGAEAWQAIQRALAHQAPVSAPERALIQALADRYAAEPPDDRRALDLAYARALAATGEVEAAEVELTQLRRLAGDPRLAEQALEFNTVGTLLDIASRVLAGHIAAERRDYERAVIHLREAARLEDEMVYGEPPEWSVPVRQDLGEVLLRAGRAAEAEQAYREDLQRFPENTWSTRGLSRAVELRKRG